ncbi:MAG: hypothetical protein IJ026_06300 [Candidatus Methanomethylophilaceae archaeon]|nr:hypothetical protein [Candidatus Methanomethylophilaceae archaeon]
MESKKIIAIFAVVIIVAAAGAFAISALMSDDDSFAEAGDQGAVFGNADGDCEVDSRDIELIEAIIAGEYDAADYPFADANCDGTVDEKDVSMTEDIIDRKNMRVNVLDVNGDIISVQFPVTKVMVTGGTNSRVMTAVLGIEDIMVAAYVGSTIDRVMDKTLYSYIDQGKILALSGDNTAADFDELSKLDFGTAIIEEDAMSDDNIKTLQSWGVDVLEMNLTGAFETMGVISTIGILTGDEDRANDYYDYCEDLYDTIEKNLGDKFGETTVMCATMSNSVSGTLSDYYAATIIAGGNNLADWEDKTKKFNVGDTWLLDPKYQSEYMFHFKSLTYESEPSTADLDKYRKYFENTSAYKDGKYYLINGLCPTPVRVAYMAELLNPECFDEGWADKIHQKYFDQFIEGSDWDVTEHNSWWSVA